MKKLFVLLGLSAITYTACADWSLGVEHINFNPEIANAEGVEDNATALNASYDWFNHDSLLKTSLGGSIVFYSDEQRFTQTVEGIALFNDGDIKTIDSTARAYSLLAETGPHFSISEQFSLITKIGINWYFSSERDIDDCTNCFSEDIKIDGGAYIGLGLIKEKLKRAGFRIHYNMYLDDDNAGIENSLSLALLF